MNQSPSRVAELCQEITKRRAESLERRIEAYPRNNPIASDISECTREMVLGITNWKDRPAIQPDLKARFERGNLIEDTVLSELAGLGIRVRVERKPFEIRDKQGRLVLRGKIDGFVAWEGLDYPMEVKSLDANVFRQVDTVEDFQRWTWASKYPRQIQSYLYANNIEEGFFLLDDCMGHWKLLPVSLDFGSVEAILRQCETAVAVVESIRNSPDRETPEASLLLPEYHKDPALCRRCWAFGRICTPPVEYHGLALMADAEFEAKLDRRGELEIGHKEYEALDKEIKGKVKGKDGILIGRWLIQGTERQRKGYEVKPSVYWETKITKAET